MSWFRSPFAERAPAVQPPAEDGPDDAAFVAAARCDPRAFDRLYERYVQVIYRYCQVRLTSREAAEDATSEIFVKALAGLPKFSDGHFAAWLFRIAHNVVVDAYRRQHRSEPLEQAGDVVSSSDTPEEVALARATRDSLRKALAALPDAQRTVIEMRLAGIPDTNVAGVLGKSTLAVRLIRFRAINRLRAELNGDGNNGEANGE